MSLFGRGVEMTISDEAMLAKLFTIIDEREYCWQIEKGCRSRVEMIYNFENFFSCVKHVIRL